MKRNPGEDSFHKETPYVKMTNQFVSFVSEQEVRDKGTPGWQVAVTSHSMSKSFQWNF